MGISINVLQGVERVAMIAALGARDGGQGKPLRHHCLTSTIGGDIRYPLTELRRIVSGGFIDQGHVVDLY